MLGNLFKPKWQHKDPKVRIQALDTLAGDSAEMISLAQHDPHSAVRMEAVVRLSHLPTLLQIGSAPGSIGERARHRVAILAATDSRHDEQLAQNFDWLQHNPTLLRSISRDSERGVKLRLQAIQQLDDQALLFEIASQDTSREIQYVAASRIGDMDKLRQLEKTLGRNNKRLRQLLKDRMAHQHQQQQRQAEREALCNDAAMLGRSAAWEQDKTRAKVLEKSWQKLANDADESQQQRFTEALEDFHQRLRLYEEREQSLQPLRGAQQEILEAAATLVRQLETTPAQQTPGDLDAAIRTLAQRWGQQEKLPAEEQALQDAVWEQHQQKLTKLRDALHDDLAALEQLRKLDKQAVTFREQDKPLISKDILNLQTRWVNAARPQNLRETLGELENSFRHSMDILNSRLEKQQKQRETTLKILREDLKRLENYLDSEQYSEAIELHHDFTRRLQDAHGLPAKEESFFQRRIQMLTPYIRELQDWRRWGTDQARRQLIETAEHLCEEDAIDPKERARKVKALRDEWRKLTRMEPHQQRQLWKEFDSTVSAAYEPSKQHFAEQARQREAHLTQRQSICAELEAMNTDTDWDNVDWREQQNTLNALRKQWKDAGTVNHKDWKTINQRFNAAMDALDTHFKAERQRNWQEREQLVEQAQALADNPDTAEAIKQAKALQQAWQVTVASRHANEQKLWKQFRQPIDSLFARAQEERQQQRDQHKTRLAEEKRQQSEQQQREQERQQQRIAALESLAQQSVARKQGETDAVTMEKNQSDGETLLLRLEILLELPTPAAFQQSRMEYQVKQMSASMLGHKEATPVLEQATALLQEWYELGGMPAGALQNQTIRSDAIRQAMYAHLQSGVSATG